MPEQNTNLQGSLHRLLSSPVMVDLSDMQPEAAEQWRDRLYSQGLLIKSLNDVLVHPCPSVELLKIVKDFAKNNRNIPNRNFPDEVLTVLYYLAIAAGLARHGECITQLADEDLQNGLRWVSRLPWVESGSRELIDSALRRLSQPP